MEKNNYGLVDSPVTPVRNTLIYLVRVILFLTGIFVLSLGVATVITAQLGVATWDVMHIGLSNLTKLSVGRWVQIVGAIMVLMTSAFERKRPKIMSVVNILLAGFFLNLILDLNFIPHFIGLLQRTTLLILGIVLMGAGSGMYVAPNIGAGPRDGMTLFISKRFLISVRLSRTILEILALIIGWLLGGPIAVGTFISIFLVGPVMQSSLKFWVRQLNRIW